MAAKLINDFKKVNRKRTSIGNSNLSRPKNKRVSIKKYRGQGKK